MGKNIDVLFESKDDDGTIKGFSSNYVRVNNLFNKDLENQICTLAVKEIKNGLVYGEVKEIKNSVELEISSV